MKKIRIYLQYPWRFPDSPYYKYLLDNPPKNVGYTFRNKQEGVITRKRFFWMSNLLKRAIRRILNSLKFPMLNAHLSPEGDYNLIHCAHCLSKNDSPWVADFESLWQIWVNGSEGKTPSGIRKARRLLLNKNCRKIIAWTERTRREFIETFPEIKDKVVVIYPGVPIPKIRKKKNKDRIILSFVARYFYQKGGLDALRVFDYVTQKFDNVEAVVVSETPKEILEKYRGNKKIRFLRLMPQKEMYEKVISRTNLFVYPGYSDTFGFSITEAMSFGIPVVSVDGKSRREIIEDGKTGFVVPLTRKYHWKELEFTEKKEIIVELIKKVEKLVENKKLREAMGKNSLKEVASGKFSVGQRNKKFDKIYREVLEVN